MNSLLTRLLDLRSLDWSDPSVSIGFERPLPAWAWAGISIAAVGLAVWSYTRLSGRAWVRWSLGGVRSLLFLLLVVLLSGPQLVKRQELSENDWVLVLVDRSASMQVKDAPAAGGSPDRSTREAQLTDALAATQGMWAELAKSRTLLWLGFDSGVRDLAPGPAGPLLGDAAGQRTSLGVAVDQALARAAARPVAGVVVLSDGRSVDEPSRQAMRRLESEKIPLVVVPLGSERPVSDVAIQRIDAPRLSFLSDLTPVRVELQRLGAGSGKVSVKLVDRTSGRVLDEKSVELETPAAGEPGTVSVALASKGLEPGPAEWAVEVSPQDGDDLVASNNRTEFAVEMIDRPLRVLYVDGYPRWEQRYLKNLLVREKSISCSTLILAPDKKFIQEGDVELDALPDSPERWAEFDAVILGDVRPDVFTKDQLLQLKEHVAQRGGGLIWIAGPSATPMAWRETALADLIPFAPDAVDGTTLATPMVMKPTPEAQRLGLLRLADPDQTEPWPAVLSSAQTGWSLLRWAQRIDPAMLKPTAEVLATAGSGGSGDGAAPTDSPSRAVPPLLISMKYGAGRVIYCATDETWRWRYARGETLYERFWTPLIRLLGRDALSRSGRSVVVEASPSRAVVDQPVRIAVQLLDQSLVDLELPGIVVRLTKSGDPASVVELMLRSEGANSGQSSGAPAGSTRIYSGVWVPPESGTYEVEVAESVFSGRVAKPQLSAGVEVSVPDDELRAPETNHPLLARLAEETGGVTVKPEDLASLPTHLPNRRVRVVNETAESLWDTPMALLLSVFLLTAEWVCRRVIRLV